MIDFSKMFLVPTSRSIVDTNDNDKEERIRRALSTILELSALLGEPVVVTAPKQEAESTTIIAVEKDSVAVWSNQVINSPSKDVLAEPTECPPYTDPSSVAIVDPGTLEFELEADPADGVIAVLKPEGAKVQFHHTVSIVEIPSHRDMCPNIVESIWTSVDEVHENAMRNSREYHADGRNWQDVKEEEDMVFDPVSGEHIHPATWEELQADRLHRAALEEQWNRVAALEEAERQKKERLLEKAREASKRSKARSKRRQKQQSANNMRGHPRPMASLTRFADT